jgi:hypothetical protein
MIIKNPSLNSNLQRTILPNTICNKPLDLLEITKKLNDDPENSELNDTFRVIRVETINNLNLNKKLNKKTHIDIDEYLNEEDKNEGTIGLVSEIEFDFLKPISLEIKVPHEITIEKVRVNEVSAVSCTSCLCFKIF